MSKSGRLVQSLVLAIVIVLTLSAVLIYSVDLLPPAPHLPTPTWPQGIELPDKLPHIVQ